MSNWYESYADTATGRVLSEIIDDPQRENEFRLLSDQGRPAVQALAKDVSPIIDALPSKAERDRASQFVGWYVGQLMRPNGFELERDRGRVTGASYKTGAVWRHRAIQPKLVTAAGTMDGCGRLELRVFKIDSETLAEWQLTTTATSPISGRPRRVHTILSVKKPPPEAASEALVYAKRHGFETVWVSDPARLFPKSHWPTIE